VRNYVDTVDCDVALMSACHATHSVHSNSYSFVHKGVDHVLKPMLEKATSAEVFSGTEVKKRGLKLSQSRGQLCIKRERMM
jgi:hypothetical protein